MKKCIALLLAALLLAAPLAVPVTAAEEASPKEEVVYVNLNADGSVDESGIFIWEHELFETRPAAKDIADLICKYYTDQV